MKDYYDDFKPIRNKLREFNLFDVIEGVVNLHSRTNRKVVPEVEEILYINSIVFSPDYRALGVIPNPRMWNKILMGLSDLNTKIDSDLMNDDVWMFMHKACLNQLKSHSNNILVYLYRYYYIFSRDEIVNHIENKLSITYKDFFICAFWIYSVFKEKHYCFNKSFFLQKRFKDTPFNIENMSKTLDVLSIPLGELKGILKAQLKYDKNMFITHSYKHVEKPIFEYDDKLFCVFSEQLLNQFTSGIYYISEIYNPHNGLSNVFGDAFENYVGTVLNKSNSLYSYRILPEIRYNREQNKTSDWIIETEKEIVFIECKTKRLQIGSKYHEPISEKDINSVSDAVTQVYKVYSDYCDSKIPDLEFNKEKEFIPLVVTLEEWFAGVISINDLVTSEVKSNLKNVGIDDSLVDRFKFHIESISDIEFDIQRMLKFGFKEHFDRLADPNYSKDDFKFNNYFSEEIEALFSIPLE